MNIHQQRQTQKPTIVKRSRKTFRLSKKNFGLDLMRFMREIQECRLIFEGFFLSKAANKVLLKAIKTSRREKPCWFSLI
jgi:hypothetical protein